jgi:hypothetical protein
MPYLLSRSLPVSMNMFSFYVILTGKSGFCVKLFAKRYISAILPTRIRCGCFLGFDLKGQVCYINVGKQENLCT